MEKISKFIVKYRNKILLIAVLLLIPSIIGYMNTNINYDILSYLPSDCESMKGQKILDEDFNLASTGIMVTNKLTDKEVSSFKQEIEKIDGVKDALWKDDLIDLSYPKEMLPDKVQEQLYDKDATIFIITFDEDTASQKTMNAISQIKKISPENCYLAGMSAIAEDTKDLANTEMKRYIVIAVILSLVILYLGLESTIAPIIFMIGIAFPIIYNFGSNFFLHEISYITQALAAILQLAVTMDYSIFLLHRYQEEKVKSKNGNEEAMEKAIVATFKSITSSSVTTIAGFLTLCFMQLKLGSDIGIVMAKGVVLGVLCTIFILPSMLMRFDGLIEKYTHRVLIKEWHLIPSWIVAHAKALCIAAVCIFMPMCYFQTQVSQYYDLTASLPSSLYSMQGTQELKERFDMNTTHFILVGQDLEHKEMKSLVKEIKQVKGIETVLSYDEFAGGLFPTSFEPEAIKEIFNNNGYQLIIVNSDYHAATENENTQIDQLHEILHKYDKKALITGEGALTKDLITTANQDFKVVNIISILAIFIIILITFHSISLPIMLVCAIELAITVNMAIPYFTQTTLPFIAGIVIGTIQLGACVDYAILLTTRVQEEYRKNRNMNEAVRTAIGKSAPSIITSGLSFFAACIGVSFISQMDLISSLCTLLARGAIISVISILFVLPSMLLLENKIKMKKGGSRYE